MREVFITREGVHHYKICCTHTPCGNHGELINSTQPEALFINLLCLYYWVPGSLLHHCVCVPIVVAQLMKRQCTWFHNIRLLSSSYSVWRVEVCVHVCVYYVCMCVCVLCVCMLACVYIL